MRKLVPLIAGCLIGLGATFSAWGADVKLKTFKENVWLCVSTQAYDTAMVKVATNDGKDIEPLKKELRESKQCMYIDEEIVESMQAPFAVILKSEGSKVQVQFVVTFRKRVEFLHRMTNRFIMVGWTEQANLVEKRIM